MTEELLLRPSADVVIVGYGPVGQSLAALLGAAGHRVTVLERRPGRYETPRAGHFDHEIMRIFQSMGIADDVLRTAEPASSYEFRDPDGTRVSSLVREWEAPSGWAASYHFDQPQLEGVIDAAVRAMPSVDIRMGTTVTGLKHDTDSVTVLLDDESTVTGRYVVGCDGARSVIRDLAGIGTEDLGFKGDWLVIDVKPLPGTAPIDMPDTVQILDPARPRHMARLADRGYRWEFMVVDGDDPAEMVKPENVWNLIAPWMSPDEGELLRSAVYEFRSIVADTFRAGSVLIAGDAAHVMPPFLGQGMGSGLRDASTLSWMLGLVLSGDAESDLLDMYTESRRPQVITYIRESMRIGTIVCETDPVRAAYRREALMSATELPEPFEPPVGAGFREGDALAGTLAVQPMLRDPEGMPVRSDDALGYGFTLFSLVDLDESATAVVTELERTIGLRAAVVGQGDVVEDGTALQSWMSSAGVIAVVVRPDFYVYGSASSLTELTELLTSLRSALSLT